MPTPKIMLISPPVSREIPDSPYPFAKVTPEIEAEARRLARLINDLAVSSGFSYFDASEYLTDEIDGVHLSAEISQALGIALAKAIEKKFY